MFFPSELLRIITNQLWPDGPGVKLEDQTVQTQTAQKPAAQKTSSSHAAELVEGSHFSLCVQNIPQDSTFQTHGPKSSQLATPFQVSKKVKDSTQCPRDPPPRQKRASSTPTAGR